MKPSTMVFLVFVCLGMLGYLTHGWMFYQTATSETNPWTKTSFATTFISWFISLIGLSFLQ